MSVVIALILVAVLGIILGTGLALVRSRKQRDTTLLEPPGAPGVPRSVKEDVARHKAELEAQIEAEEATAQTGIEVDEALAAAVEEALAAPPVEVPEAPVRPRFRDRLGKARTLLGGYVGSILSREKIDQQTWDELEEALIRADVGIEPTTELLDQLRAQVKEQG
ncbi:MAG: signal recognition particle receptor subunit alpha, partial [Acidimicrobiales bacterium]